MGGRWLVVVCVSISISLIQSNPIHFISFQGYFRFTPALYDGVMEGKLLRQGPGVLTYYHFPSAPAAYVSLSVCVG